VLSVQLTTGLLPLTVVARPTRVWVERREHERDGIVGARVDVEISLGRVRLRASGRRRGRPVGPGLSSAGESSASW
jgi:hypothetical protein